MSFSVPVQFISGQFKDTVDPLSVWSPLLTAALNVDDVAVVVIAKDNASSADGNTSEVLSVTSGANAFQKLREFCKSGGAMNNGATCSIWWCKVTQFRAAGAALAITFSDARIAMAVLGIKTTVAAGQSLDVPLDANAQADLANTAADAGPITLAGLENKEHLFVRGGAVERGNVSYVQSAGYTGLPPVFTAGGLSGSNIGAVMEWRILTATGDTTNPVTVPADQASIMLALDETVQAMRHPHGAGSGQGPRAAAASQSPGTAGSGQAPRAALASQAPGARGTGRAPRSTSTSQAAAAAVSGRGPRAVTPADLPTLRVSFASQSPRAAFSGGAPKATVSPKGPKGEGS